MKILLYSSKTMKPVPFEQSALTTPRYIDQARELQDVLASLDIAQIASLMKVSGKLAQDVHALTAEWRADGDLSPAALTFRGDIYSGLQAQEWGGAAREYASAHLWLLSGLYGVLRPFDGIRPYRLEMGYPFRIGDRSLYDYWGEALTSLVATDDTYINVTADEYLRAIKKSLKSARVISPKFLTISAKTGEPTFVTVHAKVARGAFANWLITHQIRDVERLLEFDDLGYAYDDALSTPDVPVFVCERFGGIGLSTRLS